jgi:hypothetical protein
MGFDWRKKRWSHADPVGYKFRKDYRQTREETDKRISNTVGHHMIRMMLPALDDPRRCVATAQRLLSDYTRYELGDALYMRCRRIIKPDHDVIRSKVVGKGKPGMMDGTARKEYQDRTIIHGVKRMLDG